MAVNRIPGTQFVINVDAGQIEQKLGSGGEAQRAMESMADKSEDVGKRIGRALSAGIQGALDVNRTLGDNVFSKAFRGTTEAALQAVSGVKELEQVAGDVRVALDAIDKSTSLDQLKVKLAEAAAAYRRLSEEAKEMNRVEAAGKSMAASFNINAVNKRVTEGVFTDPPVAPTPRKRAVKPLADVSTTDETKATNEAVAATDRLTASRKKASSAAATAARETEYLAKATEDYEEETGKANETKHRFEVNLSALDDIMTRTGHSVVSVSKTLEEQLVPSFAKAADVYNSVFLRAFSEGMDKPATSLKAFLANVTEAFKQADAEGVAGTKELAAEHERMAKSVQKAFGVSKEAAREYVRVLSETKDPSRAKGAMDAMLVSPEALKKGRADVKAAVADIVGSWEDLSGAIDEHVTRQDSSQNRAQAAYRATMAEAKLALSGELNAHLATTNQVVQMRQQMAQAIIQSTSVAYQSMQAFMQRLGESQSVSAALGQSLGMTGDIVARFDQHIKTLATDLGVTEEVARHLWAAIEAGQAPLTAIQSLAAKQQEQWRALGEAAATASEKMRMEWAEFDAAFKSGVAEVGNVTNEIIEYWRELGDEIDKEVVDQEKAQERVRAAYKQTEEEAARALRGELNSMLAASNEIVQSRDRMARAMIQSSSVGAQANQAFYQTLGAGGSRADALRATMDAATNSTKKWNVEIRQLAKDMGWTEKKARELWTQIEAGKQPFDVLSGSIKGLNRNLRDSVPWLRRVGEAFTALFILDRIRGWFLGALAAMREWATEGAEFQTQQQGLAITAAKLGMAQSDIGKSVETLTSRFLDQKTAVEGLRTLLNSGLGLPEATALLQQFEESALRANLHTKGLTDRVLSAAEAFRDRMSRTVGQASGGLQTNYGQAIRLANKSMDSLIAKMAHVGKSVNSVAEESKVWAATIAHEFRLVAGVAEATIPTTTGQLAIMDKNFKALRLSVGTALAPILGAFAKLLNQIIPPLIEFTTKNADLIRSLGLTTVVLGSVIAVLTTATIAFASFGAAIVFLPGIGWALLGLNALAAALVTVDLTLHGAEKTMAMYVGRLFGLFRAFQTVLPAVDQFGYKMKLTGIHIRSFFDNIGAAITGVTSYVQFAIMAFVGSITGMDTAMRKGLESMRDQAADLLQDALRGTATEAGKASQRIVQLEEIIKQHGKSVMVTGKESAVAWTTMNYKLAQAREEFKKLAAGNADRYLETVRMEADKLGNELIGIPGPLDEIGDKLNKIEGGLYEKIYGSRPASDIENIPLNIREIAESIIDLEDAMKFAEKTGMKESFGEAFARGAEEGQKVVRDFVESMKHLNIGDIAKVDDPFLEWPESADRAKERTQSLFQTLTSMFDRLQDLSAKTRDAVYEAFFDKSSFQSRVAEFRNSFEDAFRNVKDALDSKEYRLLTLDPDAVANDTKKATDAVIKEIKDAAEKTKRIKLLKIEAFDRNEVSAGLKEITNQVNGITKDIRVVFAEAEAQFIRRAFDEEMGSLREIAGLTQKTLAIVGESEARMQARIFADKIRFVEEANRRRLLSDTETISIVKDLEEAAMQSILEARSRDFRLILEQARNLQDVVVDEFTQLFNRQAHIQADIEKQRALSDAKLREEEMVARINETSKNETERKNRILAVQRQTMREIEAMNRESGNVVTRIWNRVADSMRDALIKRVVEDAMNQAIKKLVDVFPGAKEGKGLLGNAAKEAQKGDELLKQLAELNRLTEIMKESVAQEVVLLKSIDATLRDIAHKFNIGGPGGGESSEDADPNSRLRRPMGPGGRGPVDDNPRFDQPPTDQKATDNWKRVMRDLTGTMTKLAVASLVVTTALEALSGQTSKFMRTLSSVLSVIASVLQIAKGLGAFGGIAAGANAKTGTTAKTSSATRGGIVPAQQNSYFDRLSDVGVITPPMAPAEMDRLAGTMALAQRRSGSFSWQKSGDTHLHLAVNGGKDTGELVKDIERVLQPVVDRHVKTSFRRATNAMGSSF